MIQQLLPNLFSKCLGLLDLVVEGFAQIADDLPYGLRRHLLQIPRKSDLGCATEFVGFVLVDFSGYSAHKVLMTLEHGEEIIHAVA